MNIQPVSMTAPTDWGAEQKSIERRRKMAELLQQQSLQPTDAGQMVSGIYVQKSPVQGLARMLQAYSARKGMEKTDDDERALARRYQGDLVRVLQEGGRLSTGAPERPQQVDPQEIEQMADQGSPMPMHPATAPDPNAAAAMYMTHPATQGLGMQEMQRQRMMQAFGLNGGEQAGGPSAPTVGAAGGSLNGVPKNIAMGLMLADPSGKLLAQEMAKVAAEDRKPVVAREGAPVLRRGPDGQLVPEFYAPKLDAGIQPTFGPGGVTGAIPVPGYNEARAGTVRAEEGARAGFDMVQVPMPDGSSRMMTRAQAAQLMGGNQPQPNPPQPQNLQGILAGRPPAEQDAIRRVAQASSEGRGLSVNVGPFDQSRIVPPQAQQAAQGPIPSSAVLGQSQTPADKVGSEAQAKADVEKRAAQPQATAAFNDAISNMERLSAEATAVMNSSGMGGITGVRGAIPDIPGGAAANTRARLEALKSQVAFAALQAMRDASKTGGALGQVTERELAMLQNNIAALSTAQSEQALKSSLQQIVRFTQGAKQRMQSAYQSQYGPPAEAGTVDTDPLGLFK
jgi:hypothetical protein